MATAMTYSLLLKDIETYAERRDEPFIQQIPRFVMLAENRIASEVKGLGYLRFVSGKLTPNNGVTQKPVRWRETASWLVQVGDRAEFLLQRGYTFCRFLWPTADTTGVPQYYCDYDYEHLLVVPSPDADYSFELSYFERPEPLSESNQTNWTTQYAPQLLLYAALLEAQPFLKRPERTVEFQALFDRSATAVGAEAQRRLIGDQALQRTVG
jgi:hypothetical protein